MITTMVSILQIISAGDSNDVKHTQRGGGDHEGYVEINGDNNDVTLLQRGNTDDLPIC